MALTKVTGQVINTSTDVTVGVLTVTNTLAVGGTVSIGGTLTYEDVTNIDSVGLITARNGIVVGSGITLSKDGDVFFTGIATGNGSGLTALNASNLGSGTVPTARLGSGTASSSTFLRGDSTFQTVNTDLVSDTSPQLGGDLDTNGNNINFGDSGSSSDDRLVLGSDNDLQIYHAGTNNVIDSNNNWLNITSDGGVAIRHEVQADGSDGENMAMFKPDGAVELYHDNVKRFETDSTGVRVVAPEGARAELRIIGDEGDDNNDYFKLSAGEGTLKLQDASNGSSWEDNIVINAAGSVELYYDNSKKVETNSTGINMVDKVITFQGQSNRRIAYRDGENDILYEFDSGDFMRQDIGNSRHEFFVGNTKRVSVTSDGLTFGSDTAAANALDDYEEGTWSPVLQNSSGTITRATYQGAYYTKIGRMVHLYGRMDCDGMSTHIGATPVYVGGFPFSTGNQGNSTDSLVAAWGSSYNFWENGYPSMSLENNQSRHGLFIHRTPASTGQGLYNHPNASELGNGTIQLNFDMVIFVD